MEQELHEGPQYSAAASEVASPAEAPDTKTISHDPDTTISAVGDILKEKLRLQGAKAPHSPEWVLQQLQNEALSEKQRIYLLNTPAATSIRNALEMHLLFLCRQVHNSNRIPPAHTQNDLVSHRAKDKID